MVSLKRNIKLIIFVFLAGLISFLYFKSENKVMNDKNDCNFEVFSPDWDKHNENLSKRKKSLEEKINNPSTPFLKQEINDAYKDIAKREYLKESEIREAERLIEFDKQYKEKIIEESKKSLEKVESCLSFVASKNKKYYGVGNIDLCKIPEGIEVNYGNTINEYQKDLVNAVLGNEMKYDLFSYDLNSDGYDEVFISNIPGYCGSGGCTYYLLDGKKKNILLEGFGSVLIGKNINNNYIDIYQYGRNYRDNEKGKENTCNYDFTTCSFDGERYKCKES